MTKCPECHAYVKTGHLRGGSVVECNVCQNILVLKISRDKRKKIIKRKLVLIQ